MTTEPIATLSTDLDVEEIPALIDDLRRKILSCVADDALEPEAREYHFLTLSALDQAGRFAWLAIYKMRQRRALDSGGAP